MSTASHPTNVHQVFPSNTDSLTNKLGAALERYYLELLQELSREKGTLG